MNNPVAVKIIERMNELLGNLADFRLTKTTVIFKDLKQLTLGELCDDAEFMGGLKGVKH